MRIISGTHKGRRLIAPKNLPVRPTTDFAKEGLFNILRNQYDFSTITILDLFAGTGNISFEFASRGGQQITAVDTDHGCVKYIQKIAQEFDFPINSLKMDSYTFLEKPVANSYDLIFADPPYSFKEDQLKKLTEKVMQRNLLKEDGILIIEHSKQTLLSHFHSFYKSRNYGGCVFSFFKKADL